MAEAMEAKDQSQPNPLNTIAIIENELNELRLQLHKIEEQIRLKSAELSNTMAQSVSLTDINEILDIDRETSDASLSLSMDSMEHKDSTEYETQKTPISNTDKPKKKKKKKNVDKKRKAKDLWKELENQIKDGNIEYVKKLIQLNKVKINDNTQWNGRTMLMMASEHAQYDICCMLINLGADVTTTTKYDDTRDAQYFAHKMGYYHIERLLLISSFGGESSAKIKDIIKTLKKQQAISSDFIKTIAQNDNEKESKVVWIQHMIEYLCASIQKKMAFSDDLLSICWNYMMYKHKDNVLSSDLWKVIIKSCSEVIHGRDSNDWYWFKQYMLKSTIWLNADPLNNDKLGLNGLLIRYLFDITYTQSNINNVALKRMEEKFKSDWKSLVGFDIKTNYGTHPRQDEIANGLIAKYSKEELSQNINPSTTFNALKHYDINQYLPHLLLICHMMNDEYQECIMNIFGINAATNTNMNDKHYIAYRRGPIKQVLRCKAKAENDYRSLSFPSSAHLLDVVRCTLIFNDVKCLLDELNSFVNKINNNKCGVIKEVVRVKNGFCNWNSNNPNYCDIKLNVLIKTNSHYAVIGEIQFLLNDMSIYKLVSHKLYSITRLDEEYLSLLKIKPIMMDHKKCLLNASYFNDSKEISSLMVLHQKDVAFIADNISLKTICETNGFKLLKILCQYMDKEQLIMKLKECGGFQAVCSKGYFELIEYIYLQILPSNTDKYDDILKNGLSEIINSGYFEILNWMFNENRKHNAFKFLNLWNEFDATDKHTFFRVVCELGATDCAKLLVHHFGDVFDPNWQSADRYCALTKAIRKKRIETVKWLVKLKYIDLIANNEKKGKIALFEAVDIGCFEIGDLLLSEYKTQGHDPKKMLAYKANFGHSIQVFVRNAGYRGNKRKEAIAAVKKWAVKYDVVELQIKNFDVNTW